jgi:transmembrane sensor
LPCLILSRPDSGTAAPTPAATVYAEGQPLALETAMQAATWLTTLMSGDATSAERQAWRHWRQAHPDHDRAWRHIEQVSGNFQALDAQASRQALAQRPASRRQGLRTLVLLAAFGVTGWFGSRTPAARALLADVSTGAVRRELVLADGSVLHLNVHTAVNLRFTATERLLQLVQGELYITTAREARMPYRPLLVETVHGRALALGTRYSVRLEDDLTTAAVAQGRVRLTPHNGADSMVLGAGQRAAMDDAHIQAAQVAPPDTWAWRQGLLVADAMPLGDFLHALSRYRSGFIGCDAAIASLRISGVFPVGDTDAVLRALPESLPVSLHFRTAYWVQVKAK